MQVDRAVDDRGLGEVFVAGSVVPVGPGFAASVVNDWGEPVSVPRAVVATIR